MLLLSLWIFLAQGIPGLRVEGGTVSGVVTTVDGLPAVGVRVAAAALPDSTDRAAPDTLVSITQTDKNGRYLLEEIPPGRIYITAGSVRLPTYYPGTLDVKSGTVLAVTSGQKITGVDFAVKDESTRLDALSRVTGAPSGIEVPLNFSIDGGGKVPVVSGDYHPTLRLVQPSAARGIPFNAASVILPIPSASISGDYRVEVVGLPPNYALKSISFGFGPTAVDLTANPLQISAQMIRSQAFSLTGGTSISVGRSGDTLFVSLTQTAPQSADSKGVRVSGTLNPALTPVYLSGVPGTVYSDGSFEFENVLPGLYSLVRYVSTTAALGSVVAVGDRNVEGVRLTPLSLLPQDIEADLPRSVGSHVPGEILALASIRGRAVHASSGVALAEGGVVTIIGYGDMRRSYAISGEGDFRIPDLLPGSYRLELGVSGYRADEQTVVISDDRDLEIVFRGEQEIAQP